jgi:hypothetical protein
MNFLQVSIFLQNYNTIIKIRKLTFLLLLVIHTLSQCQLKGLPQNCVLTSAVVILFCFILNHFSFLDSCSWHLKISANNFLENSSTWSHLLFPYDEIQVPPFDRGRSDMCCFSLHSITIHFSALLLVHTWLIGTLWSEILKEFVCRPPHHTSIYLFLCLYEK